jgi:DNA-binding response OmpR family regulator
VSGTTVQPTILAVDDEEDFLNTYRRLLGRQGLRVVTASSRAAALDALAREPFALVIVDLRLPDGDGLEIVRAAQATSSPTPAIVVSGFASETIRRNALSAGAAAVFTKPFDTAALAARIRELAR